MDDDVEGTEQTRIPSEEWGVAADATTWSAMEALATFDATWYTGTSQSARWMDILGDYAGEELFLLNGDSLLSVVLDDPLLALAKETDVSFQYLHARYSLERALKEYIKRNAVFEIVFFDEQRHVTCHTGECDFVTTSRCLARSLLKSAVQELSIPLHTFSTLDDPAWHHFCIHRKPMFIMTDDGGPVHDDIQLRAARTLTQRTFIYELLTSGIAVALMRGAEFKDAKIFSFIYEQRRISNARGRIYPRIWKAKDRAVNDLNADLPPRPSDVTKMSENRTDWLVNASRAFLDHVEVDDTLAGPLLYIFLAHGVTLDKIPLSLRAQPLPALSSTLKCYLRDKFFPSIFDCLDRSLPKNPTFRDVDLDGRVFLHLLQAVPPQSSIKDVIAKLIGPKSASDLAGVWNTLGRDIGDISCCVVSSTEDRESIGESGPEMFSVLPFSHPILSKHLARVQIDTASSTSVPDFGRFDLDSGLGTLFKDTMHWHNSRRSILPKHLGGEGVKLSTLDPRARFRALRRSQKFQDGLQRQAESLTGALGKPIEAIIISPVGKASKASAPKTSIQRQCHAPASKKTKMTSKEKLLLQVQTEKLARKAADDLGWWCGKGGKLLELQRRTLNARIQETDLLLRNPRMVEGLLAVEVPLYRLNLELRAWVDHPTPDAPLTQDRFRVSILRMIREQSVRATPTATQILSSVLGAIGFSAFAPSLLSAGDPCDHDVTFEFVKVAKKSGSPVHSFMKLDGHPVRWLLRCFGEYMDRSLDSMPDQRVQFAPDRWQREVLDSLDEDVSVLVVAPTSAGKTFISFYAMERVLRSSDDGILVYVAPTKALVTQIAAEVSARFKKDIKGQSCWAVHTRDYRIHDPQKCQILITVPEILAIMLLSPALAIVWTPRLRRIILDEIHSIGQEEGGSVWEQILLLAPCPIIGLSATVGDPKRFNDWLSSVQEAHDFKHKYIYHPHRYSHLRKYFYLRLRFLHPVCMLASGMARAIPPDFSLEAGDCLTLFDALQKLADTSDIIKDEIENLEPSRFFPLNTFLKQQNILQYEKALITLLSKLIQEPNSHEESSALQGVVQHLTDRSMAESREDLLAVAPTESELHYNLIHLVSDLYAEGDLPALIFSFDRHQCETQAQIILHGLEEAEESWRATSPEWQAKIKDWERYQSKAKDRDRTRERSQRQRKDEEEGGTTMMQEDTAWQAHFDPSDPSLGFSLAGVKISYDKTKLAADLDDLSWTSTPRWAKEAIKRGIAVHHSGMNKQYRNLVETLFRIGFLQVVIATGTLALGINAPCKTVVFSGDSTFLTALQYRQAAGRAGRRGFDLLGKVVFHGITLDRVQRLVLSRLPPISGQFPLSTTLCLRLLNLLAGSQNADYAVTAVSGILSLPQISLGSETGRHQLLHHLRFSIDYLRRAHLLSSDGKPLNLAGIVTHLFYHHPNNLAFVALLRAGIIHKICNQGSKTKAAQDLMLVLCYLFGRRLLPQSALKKANLQFLLKRYPSVIVLPPLPKPVLDVLEEHNTVILRVFTGYAWTYASQNTQKLGSDDVLPLSEIQVTSSAPVEDEFFQKLRSTAPAIVVRSAFVATSGHVDSFASVGELCREARRGLHMNEHAIPSMDAILADTKSPFMLNAYLLDFYTHGQVEPLIRANGIRRGDVWYLLQDFVLTLLTIKSSLQELLEKAPTQETRQDEEDSAAFDIGPDVDLDDRESIGDDGFSRPPGVDDTDWKVYETFSDLVTEFGAKFKKMWA